MSLEKRMMLLAGLLSLNACSDEHNIENRVNIAGVSLKTGVTDSDGNESFTDDHNGSNLNIHVSDEDHKSLPNVNILFADGYDFGLFLLNHDDYQPRLYPVSTESISNGLKPQSNNHNFNYNFSLTKSPLQFVYYDKNDLNYEGAKNAFAWSQSWHSTGCYNKEELGVIMKPGGYLIKLAGSYLTIGASDFFVDDLAETLKNEVKEDEVVVMKSFVPKNYGVKWSTTTVASLEIVKGSCGSHQNQQEEENANYECEGTIFCDHFNEGLDKWSVQGSAYLNNGWLKMEGANIINKGSIYFQQCNSAEVQYRAKIDGNYGLYLGNEIALYADGDNGNLQFVCGSEGKNINPNLENNHAVKVQLGSSLSVNGNSIPCYNKPEYVNFSAGSVSTLKLDYVEVKCIK